MDTNVKTSSTLVTDVARLMADETACAHSVWYESRHAGTLSSRDGQHGPIDRDPRRTSLIRKAAAELEEQGCTVFPTLRNHFEARGARSGARISGRPDLIVRNPDGNVTVYDVRDGEPGDADVVPVKLYMYLLPRANRGLWRGRRPAGCVLHVDGTARRIAADEIDAAFADRVAAVMRQIVSEEPAPYRPSATECGRCPLTSEHCSERVDVAASNGNSSGMDGRSTC